MKRNLVYVVILIALGLSYFSRQPGPGSATSIPTSTSASISPSTPSGRQQDGMIQRAFQRHLSHIQVHGKATVIKVLPDDLNGIRHQRFLLRLGSGQTLLVAHNIDLAARLPSLHKGSKIEFNGEYIWNEKGGILHWTHRDPGHRHADGWLRFNGKTYQ